jgi:dTDP-4-dehydrorhamnose reductase
MSKEIVIGADSRVLEKNANRIFIASDQILEKSIDSVVGARSIIFASYSRFSDDEKAISLYKLAAWLKSEGFSKKTLLLSTDHVFDGMTGYYSATDKVKPTSPYGKFKVNLESILYDAKIIRFTVYGPSNSDSPLLEELIRQGKSFDLYCDQYFSPVSTFDVNIAIASAWSADWKIKHLAGPRISKAEIALKIMEKYKVYPSVRYVSGIHSDYSLVESSL